MDAGEDSVQARREAEPEDANQSAPGLSGAPGNRQTRAKVNFREGGDLPTSNPAFSVAGLNPAFTKASGPPPQPAPDAAEAQRDARIRELERLLEQASEQIARGTAALERSRKRR